MINGYVVCVCALLMAIWRPTKMEIHLEKTNRIYINVSFFSNTALKEHDIQGVDESKVELYDGLGTPIPEDIFGLIVRQFMNSSSFIVELKLGDAEREEADLAEVGFDFVGIFIP